MSIRPPTSSQQSTSFMRPRCMRLSNLRSSPVRCIAPRAIIRRAPPWWLNNSYISFRQVMTSFSLATGGSTVPASPVGSYLIGLRELNSLGAAEFTGECYVTARECTYTLMDSVNMNCSYFYVFSIVRAVVALCWLQQHTDESSFKRVGRLPFLFGCR